VGFSIPNAQRVLPPTSNDGQEDQAIPSNMIGIIGLPASAVGLLRQLLVSMARKEKVREDAQIGENVKAKEKEVSIVLEENIDIVESSAQVEARAIKGINKPYCV
jgi:hypothetical protein